MLALATDSAYPYDYRQAPAGTVAQLGYVGRSGYTPHVWTRAEADAARAAGLRWWPIVTGISIGPTSALDGHLNAQTMIAQAPLYGVKKTDPVFCDLEPDSLHADPAGARAMAATFRNEMHAAGYPRAYIYSTNADFIDWEANWTNVRPAILPAGRIGLQYGGMIDFDLSVFDPVLLSPQPSPPGPSASTELDMFIAYIAPDTLPEGVSNPGDYLIANNTAKHIIDPRSLASYQKLNLPVIGLTYAEFISYPNVTQ